MNLWMSLSSASTHRAWQELPRKLRRRAASHDVRRVPARLRGKARAEVSERLLSHILYDTGGNFYRHFRWTRCAARY